MFTNSRMEIEAGPIAGAEVPRDLDWEGGNECITMVTR